MSNFVLKSNFHSSGVLWLAGCGDPITRINTGDVCVSTEPWTCCNFLNFANLLRLMSSQSCRWWLISLSHRPTVYYLLFLETINIIFYTWTFALHAYKNKTARNKKTASLKAEAVSLWGSETLQFPEKDKNDLMGDISAQSVSDESLMDARKWIDLWTNNRPNINNQSALNVQSTSRRMM